jgi:hypothetical protein
MVDIILLLYYINSSNIDKALSWGILQFMSRKRATDVMLACFVSFILFPVTIYSKTYHQFCFRMSNYLKLFDATYILIKEHQFHVQITALCLNLHS